MEAGGAGVVTLYLMGSLMFKEDRKRCGNLLTEQWGGERWRGGGVLTAQSTVLENRFGSSAHSPLPLPVASAPLLNLLLRHSSHLNLLFRNLLFFLI